MIRHNEKTKFNNYPQIYTSSRPQYTNDLYGNISCDPCKKLHVECVLDQKYSFFLIKLISNRLNQARNQDPDLVNPWGSVYSNNVLWVANNKSGLITSYGPSGNKLSIDINVIDRAAGFKRLIELNSFCY